MLLKLMEPTGALPALVHFLRGNYLLKHADKRLSEFAQLALAVGEVSHVHDLICFQGDRFGLSRHLIR